jgi:hypothetical protein
VNLADGGDTDCASGDAAFVDPLLDGDMRLGFALEIALFCVQAVVALQRARYRWDAYRGLR